MRSFNRLWTGVIDVLNAGLLDTPYTLTEARVIYELAQSQTVGLLELRRRLGLDPSYLTRIVQRFKYDGIVTASTAAPDRRRQVLRLTTHGRGIFATLDQRSAAQNRELLSRISPQDRRQLIKAMSTIRQIITDTANPPGHPAIPGRQP
jgi:DNA-binding MarR family transcriptional regulator